MQGGKDTGGGGERICQLSIMLQDNPVPCKQKHTHIHKHTPTNNDWLREKLHFQKRKSISLLFLLKLNCTLIEKTDCFNCNWTKITQMDKTDFLFRSLFTESSVGRLAGCSSRTCTTRCACNGNHCHSGCSKIHALLTVNM